VSDSEPDRVPWPEIAVFLAITLLIPWVLTAPFHLGLAAFEGVVALVVAAAMMWAPTIATIVTLLLFDRRAGWWRRVGLGVPGGRWLRFLGVMALALVVPLIVSFAAPFAGAALGWIRLDLTGLSGLRELMEAQLAGSGMTVEQALGGLPLWIVVATAPINMVLGAFINVVLGTFGEEFGWRGFLQPRLDPMGAVASLVLVGVIWGFWHAPIILLGHNYPDAPVLGVFLFVPFCVIWSILLGATRRWTGSLWPAALGHGAINASAGFIAMVIAAGEELDAIWVSPVGISGMILPFLLAAVVVIALVLRPGTTEDARSQPAA